VALRPIRGHDAQDADLIGIALEPQVAGVDVGDAIDLRREVDHGFGRQRLPRSGLGTQPGGQVQRRAAIAVPNGDGLAGVQADADAARQVLLDQARLQLHRRAERVAGGHEDDQGLVASQLEEEAAPRRDHGRDDLGETCCQRGPGLVTVLAGVGGIPANVGDQKRPQLGGVRARRWSRCGRLCVGRGGRVPAARLARFGHGVLRPR